MLNVECFRPQTSLLLPSEDQGLHTFTCSDRSRRRRSLAGNEVKFPPIDLAFVPDLRTLPGTGRRHKPHLARTRLREQLLQRLRLRRIQLERGRLRFFELSLQSVHARFEIVKLFPQ